MPRGYGDSVRAALGLTVAHGMGPISRAFARQQAPDGPVRDRPRRSRRVAHRGGDDPPQALLEALDAEPAGRGHALVGIDRARVEPGDRGGQRPWVVPVVVERAGPALVDRLEHAARA